MHPELTNLLPEDRTSALRRDYFFRLATVALVLLLFVIIAHGVFLMPSYQFVEAQIADRTVALAGIKAALASSDEASLDARVSALTKRSTVLSALASTPSKTALIAQVLQIPHPGVSLIGFTLTPGTGGAGPSVEVRGVADTRDNLRAYDVALSGATFIKQVDLPVSAYADATNVNFTVTLTMNP